MNSLNYTVNYSFLLIYINLANLEFIKFIKLIEFNEWIEINSKLIFKNLQLYLNLLKLLFYITCKRMCRAFTPTMLHSVSGID